MTERKDMISGQPVLFLFGGLPAAGKTSVARALAARTGACHLRLDTLEQALIRTGACPAEQLEGKGYRIACELAADQLANGVSVIADCVNPLELTRNWWRAIAAAAGCPCIEVELFCSDAARHRARAENRICDIEGLRQPDWEQILNREYERWDAAHLSIDTARLPIAESVRAILEYARSVSTGFGLAPKW